jgi:hypothetical protein
MWQLQARRLGLEVSHDALHRIAEIDPFKGKGQKIAKRLKLTPTT